MLERYLPAGLELDQLACCVPGLDESLVICAHPFPPVVKSLVKSFPELMPLKVVAPARITDTTKSPVPVVVTAAPGVVLATVPVAVLAASGVEFNSPETSHSPIRTYVVDPANLGVITVAPGFAFTAYQISIDSVLKTDLAPAET